MSSSGSVELSAEVRRAVPVLTVARLTGNIAFRFVYPFLPAISRGLGISLGAAGWALALRDLTGLAAPRFGRLIDHGRQRPAMVISVAVMAVASLLAGVSAGVVLFTAAMVLLGFAKVAYDTAMTAWLGDSVPYVRRGRITGITELSWAGSFLLGVPVMGFLIEWLGWRSPFVALFALNLTMAVAVAASLSPDPVTAARTRRRWRPPPGSVPVFVTVGLINLSIQLLFVVYGAWMEDAFGLSVATIGAVSILVGASELAGSGSTVALTDRLGKQRSILLGTLVMIPPLALLGTVGGSTVLGVALVGVAVAGYEFAQVSSFPLVSELDPSARGSAIGVAVASFTVARAVGTPLGIWLFTELGIGPTGMVAAAIAVASAVLLVGFVREPGHDAARRAAR